MLLLLVANVINLGADLGAMGAALALLLGGNARLYTVGFGVACVLAEVFLSYALYAGFLKWLTLSLFAYVAVVFTVHVPWGEALLATVVPHLSFGAGEAMALVAVLGTTISPYLFFWQAALEVEERRGARRGRFACRRRRPAAVRAHPDRHGGRHGRVQPDRDLHHLRDRGHAARDGRDRHPDLVAGGRGAAADRGEFTFAVFAAGIIGTGLLAVPVLAGSAPMRCPKRSGGGRGWTGGCCRRRSFYATIAVATLAGVGLNFTRLDPVKALYWSAVVNGVLAAPVMAAMMLVGGNGRIMGRLTLPRGVWIGGWLATAVMAGRQHRIFRSLV